jgi:hypothetical protein
MDVQPLVGRTLARWGMFTETKTVATRIRVATESTGSESPWLQGFESQVDGSSGGFAVQRRMAKMTTASPPRTATIGSA